VNRAAMRFWGSAAVASIAFAALVPLLFPFRAIGLDPATERERIWLVVVFYTGVLLVLFGLGAWISGRRSVGLRDIYEAGGVKQALDRAGATKSADEAGYTQNAAAWCVVTGVLLLVIYFALYAVVG
jgi:hypothetical protein